jgi:uncharacterized protein YjbJ (UPF0337 family)
MINREILEGNWNQLKGKLQQKWGQLTDNDVGQFRGNVDELVGMIQQKTGEGRETIERFLQETIEHAGSFVGQAAETARQYVHQATDSVRSSARHAVDEVHEGLEGVEGLVRERPGQSLAICFGAGMLLGLAIALTWRCK